MASSHRFLQYGSALNIDEIARQWLSGAWTMQGLRSRCVLCAQSEYYYQARHGLRWLEMRGGGGGACLVNCKPHSSVVVFFTFCMLVSIGHMIMVGWSLKHPIFSFIPFSTAFSWCPPCPCHVWRITFLENPTYLGKITVGFEEKITRYST